MTDLYWIELVLGIAFAWYIRNDIKEFLNCLLKK